MHILLITSCIWLVVVTLLALRWMPDNPKNGTAADAGLRAARRRLTNRLVKAEIRSISRRFRRELDDELDRLDSQNGHNHV